MRTMHERRSRITGLAAVAAALCAASAFAGVNRWTTHWPSEAYARQLAIDPVNSDVVYAATDSGIFKSGDGGSSWENLLQDVDVHCVAIDPETASVQVGTASGILATADGGASWSSRLATAHAIETLLFGPQHTTYAIDSDYPDPSTLYKSSDDGTTWTAVVLPFVMLPGSLVIDPTRPSTLYAGISPAEFATTWFHVAKSVDGGVTWSTLPVLTHGALVMDPQNPATLYVGDDGGVSKTLDSGSTWSWLSSPDLTGLEVVSLAIDPRNPTTLYAGAWPAGVFRSTDGGASWKKFGAGLPHEFVYSLSIDSTGKRLHAVSGGAVFDYQIFTGALDLAAGSDNVSRLLFTDTDAHLTFRSVDSAGNSTSAGPYGPYSGWFPSAVANGSDGLTRVLWSNPDGSAALWLYGASGNQASFRLGPVQGWTAVDVAAGTPGTTHILWTHEDGRVGFWAVDNSGQISYGPKLPADPGWTAIAIAGGADGLTWLLWNKVDGSAGLSLVGRIRTRAVLSNLPSTSPFRILPVPPPEGLLATYRYGGSAGWRAVDVVVGADGQARILWTHADGRMALWRVDDSGNVTTRGPVYDAPAGFTAQRVGAGPDGLTQVLWNDLNGSALLWQMSSDNVYQQSFTVGPN